MHSKKYWVSRQKKQQQPNPLFGQKMTILWLLYWHVFMFTIKSNFKNLQHELCTSWSWRWNMHPPENYCVWKYGTLVTYSKTWPCSINLFQLAFKWRRLRNSLHPMSDAELMMCCWRHTTQYYIFSNYYSRHLLGICYRLTHTHTYMNIFTYDICNIYFSMYWVP